MGMTDSEQDEKWMAQALDMARQGQAMGEVPIGALLVSGNRVLAQAHNQSVTDHDPSAHSEILTLRRAGKAVENYRLLETTLYVTLEPCLMCAGAMVHARIARLVFGAYDPKSGVIESCANILEAPHLNHKIQWRGGVLERRCGELLRGFFREKR